MKNIQIIGLFLITLVQRLTTQEVRTALPNNTFFSAQTPQRVVDAQFGNTQ